MNSEDNGPPPPAPATPAPRALCADHPERAAIGTCERCGNFYCEWCAGRREGEAGFCRNCHSERAYVAWEDESLTLWQRYFRTTVSSLIELPKFAAQLPGTGGIGRPLIFGLVPTALSLLIATAGASMFFAIILESFAPARQQPMPAAAMGVFMFVMYVGVGIGAHLAYLFIWPAVLLGTARAFGNQQLQYEGAFRVICYACGFNFLYVVPLIGLVAIAFHVVVSAFGLAAQGRTSLPVGFAIYCVPALLLGGCCCGAYFGIFLLVAESSTP